MTAGALTNLGVAVGQLGRTEEALEIYRRAPDPFGTNTMNLWNKSEALMTLGRFRELDSLIEVMPEPWREGRRSAALIAERRFDAVDSMRAQGLREDPPRNAQQRGRVQYNQAMAGIVRGRVEKAGASLQERAEFASEQGWDVQGRGFFEESKLIHSLSAGRPIPPSMFTPQDTSVDAQLLFGVSAALNGNERTARDILSAVRARDERDLAWYGGGPLVLEAAIAAGNEDWEEVTNLLGPAGHWNWPYSTFRGTNWAIVSWLLLGEGYEQTGQLDSAAAYFELLGTPGEYVRRDDIQRAGLTYSFAHFRRGRILTELGKTEEAREAWLTFLDAFTDPDPDYEWMVTEANESLARLAGETVGN
jgi:tetratricopeptide (TPR) repeat protein